MKRRTFVIVNGLTLVCFLVIIGVLSNANILNFNITGYTFAEFYDSQVMYTLNAIAGEQTTFVIPIQNDKDAPLKNVYAHITIYDEENNNLTTIRTKTINLDANSSQELQAFWDNEVYPGTYHAQIYIHSEESDAIFSKTFEIKRRTIVIESIQVDEFELEKTVNIDIVVQNYLQQIIENTTAHILIYNTDGETISNIQVQNTDLNMTAINKLSASWDTSDITPGTYNAQVLVENERHSTSKDIVFTIGQDSLRVLGVGFAIHYTPEDNTDSWWTIGIILIGIILVNIVVWRVYLHKKENAPAGI